MRRAPLIAIALVTLVTLLTSAATASALQTPGRSLVRDGPVTAVGLTHGSVAFAVGRTNTDCDHVELWNTDTRGTWRFGRSRPCGDLPLFSGLGPIGVAGNRAVWVSFAGGNLTDWQVWTATPSMRTPRRLAFVERDTSAPPAVTVGEGTDQAVPYAVGADVTWLGANGAAVFRWTAPDEVRAVTSGLGPSGWRVAAALANGDVYVLDATGAVLTTFHFAAGPPRWLALAPAGLLVQVPGARVEIHSHDTTRTVQMRANAIVLDYAEGRLLYRVGQTFRLRHIRSGAETKLLQGSPKARIQATLDTHGLAWTQGDSVYWACAVCLDG